MLEKKHVTMYVYCSKLVQISKAALPLAYLPHQVLGKVIPEAPGARSARVNTIVCVI